MIYGATQKEWDHFSLVLDLTDDLLPVVSNPNAEISPNSKMKGIGKTPSRFNTRGQVAGIKDWTQKHTTQAEVELWSDVTDLGICIQTRYVRAIDVDIDNNDVIAKDVYDEITKFLQSSLPCRRRANSSKFLLAFTLSGDFTKRIIRTDHGIIEFLANGQQFIAAGTHSSGTRYEWEGGLPDDIPSLDADTFERLWARLVECFATDGSSSETSTPTIKHEKLKGAVSDDPVAQHLIDSLFALSTERDGRIHIICPFASEHTNDSDESATTYFPAFTGGFKRGHFKCLHAHCAGRSDADFLAALGFATGSGNDEFDVEAPEAPTDGAAPKNKYVFESWEAFIDAPAPQFHIKGVLPEAELVVIFGDSGSGKTFLGMDMGMAVARGEPWRGLRVKQGAVAYIAAEDAHGVRMRAKAYAQHNEIEKGQMPFYMLGASPNFRDQDDMTRVAKAVYALGPVSLIFVDTWARVIAGGDENSAKDVSEAVNMCAKLHRSTGATVVLIHHSGKDSSKGARGSSALRAAADGEIEVSRFEDDREAQVMKLKNSQDGARYGFRLHVVPVGVDEDGDVVSSCVVEHTDVKVREKKTKMEAKGVNEKMVMRAVNDLCVGGAVSQQEIIDAAVSHIAFDPAEGKRDKRREHVLRALNALSERGSLVTDNGMVSMKGGGA